MKSLFLTLLLATHAPADELLENGDCEAGQRSPDRWEKGAPISGVEYRWAEDVGFESRRSLALHKTIDKFFPIAQWTQTLAHEGDATRLHVGALIKAAAVHKALLDVQFLGSEDSWSHAWAAYVGAHSNGDPAVTHDWQWYSGVVAIPPGTRELRIGLQMYGPGEVWFDRVSARYVPGSTPLSDATQVIPIDAARRGELPATASKDPTASADLEASVEDRMIDDDPRRRYLLNRPRASKPPSTGYRLLVVLPGGTGSADFQPFVSRIAREALNDEYAVAQVVAPVWSDTDDRIIWPTKQLPDPRMKFSTEELVQDVIADVKRHLKVDDRHVYALGWSSGGPPVYALALLKDSPIRGAFVAMSVFKNLNLPSLKTARKQAFYLLHSPEDWISIEHAEDAEKRLGKAGASVTLQSYAGGHGWHGDVYGMIRTGVRWLEDNRAGRSR